MVSELGGSLDGSIDEAASAIMALMPSAPQPEPDDEDDAPSPEPTPEPEAPVAAAPATDEPNTDEEAPQGDMPVEAAPAAPNTQPQAQAPQAPIAPQVQPKVAPNTAQPSAAQHLQQLTQHVTQLQANLQAAFPDIKSLEDLKRLAVEDPARVVAFDAHQREVQAAASHLPRLQAVAQAEWEQAETVRLHELLPDLKDSAKGAALREKIAAYAIEAGYSPQKLQTVSAVEVKALHDAMQYREYKAKQDAEAKKQADAIVEARKKAADAPPVQKPGSPKGSDGKAEKAAELKAKHEKSGRIDDLAAYLTFIGQG
jgi:hypothetical protein